MTVNPDKHNDARYGIIDERLSDSSVSITFRGKTLSEKVPTRLVIPLVGECLVGDKVAKTASLQKGVYSVCF